MNNTLPGRYSQTIHPLHAVLLAGSVTLFLGATLSDLAYAATFQIQWSTFASWLIAGGLLLAGVALVFALVDVFRAHRRGGGVIRYTFVLLTCWLAGFVNALVHARDAWASMPAGLVLSIIITVLAAVATWLGFNARHSGELR